MRAYYWHYWIGLLISLALVPVLHRLGLPVRFDWVSLSIAYWFLLGAQSIFVAAVLCSIGLPKQTAWAPPLRRYRDEPLRILLTLVYFCLLGWAFTWTKALILTIDTVALLEFLERRSRAQIRQAAGAVLVPAIYFFFGFLLVLAYNSIIVSVRFNFAFDPAFSTMDKWILHGSSVPALAHWAARTLPLSFFRLLEFIYFGMFPQIGATIVIVALCEGRRGSLQFVGTILLAYYFALGLFYLWPSQGPYYLYPGEPSHFPTPPQTYIIQQTLVRHALALWNHAPIHRISTDYFIGFPCMHIAQPIIVMWYVRRWKAILIALCAYDALLIVSILLLEWHYVVDILGGALVAAISIAITNQSSWRGRGIGTHSATPVREGTLSFG